MSTGPRVKAAGGVIVRQTVQGEAEVLLIHRPRRDDRTFPMGKVEPGETDDEVDAVWWVPLSQASQVPTYERDRTLLDALAGEAR